MQVFWNLLTYVLLGYAATGCTVQDDPVTVPTIMSEAYEPCCGLDTLRYQFGPHWVTLPNVFTPNGDGVNDFFYAIRSSDSLQINNFQIWGVDTLNNKRLLHGHQFLYLSGNRILWWDGIRYNVDNNRTPHRGKFGYEFTVFYRGKGFLVEGSACAILCDEEAKIFVNKKGCYYQSQMTNNGDFDLKLPRN